MSTTSRVAAALCMLVACVVAGCGGGGVGGDGGGEPGRVAKARVRATRNPSASARETRPGMYGPRCGKIISVSQDSEGHSFATRSGCQPFSRAMCNNLPNAFGFIL